MGKNALKIFTIFCIGGLIYGIMEIIARGYSHITMGILGGVTMIVIHELNDQRRKGMSFLPIIAITTLFITSIEFISGEILNVYLNMNIWDYSDMPLNFDGQICLPFIGIWFVLSFFGIVVDDFTRYILFHEDKNFRYFAFNKTASLSK